MSRPTKHQQEVAAAQDALRTEYPVEFEVLLAARRLTQTCSLCSTMMSRGTMSTKSYVESVLQAETKFIHAVAGIRQKESIHEPR